jgi:predicted ATPase/DNA-binding CsgD family transcriptional regulator
VPRRVSSPEFVGRGPELAALLDALDRAAAGEFAAVFVAGDSGVGKSRLVGELERTATERGARVLAGDCVSLGEGQLPYAPVRSALRGLARELDPASIEELLGRGRNELGRLVPELDTSGSPLAEPADGEPIAQARLFDLLLAMLARLADRAPLVLTIEDVHWADRSTLDLIAFLLANAHREPLCLVCSYRTDEVHRGHPLRTFLAQHERPPTVERVDLAPFTPEELAGQLEGILGTAPEPALVARLHERTDGNAFFTEELLVASEVGTGLPSNVREALILRIEVLSEAAQEVLRLAATHGRLVTHRLLATACELPERDLHDAVREAVAHHVLVQDDEETYAFRHALLQEALESDLLPGERTRLHLALAQAIEADPGVVSDDGRAAAELCGHWLGAHLLPQALGAAVRAGAEAEEVYAFSDARHQFERALQLWDRVEDAEQRAGMDEGELYARAALGAHLSGAGPESIRLIEAAIEKVDGRADPHRAALLRERLGRYVFLVSGETEAAQTALEEALDLLPADEPGQERARVLATLGGMLMLRGYMSESIERSEEALEVARQVGARAEEAYALNTLGVDFTVLGDRDRGIRYLREALGITEELGEIDGLVRAFMNLADALDHDGRLEESVELALAGAARARELGARDWTSLLHAEAAGRLLKLGRLDEADRLTETALELTPSLAKLDQCSARARIEVQRGRIAEAEPLLAAAAEAMPHAPGSHWFEPSTSARMEFELLRGQPEEARVVGERALERAADHETVFYTARLHALTARAAAEVAERARAGGDEPAAAAAAAVAASRADRVAQLLEPGAWRGPPPSATVVYGELCAAESARAAGTSVASEWAAISRRWEELGLRLEHAYARLREAECLLLAGDRKPAEQAAAIGLGITGEAGAGWLGGELESLARRGRLSVAADAPPAGRGPSDAVERLGLTERELKVLELVATGMTNRQIGERLFMAEKTASVHVSRILAKLDVSSRVEAATAAQRLGIVA